MTIRAVIFDLGGVLTDMNIHKYEEDRARGIQSAIYDYEQLNTQLAQFLTNLRPRYKTATICNGGSREAANRKFRLGELVNIMVFDGEEGISKPDVRIYQRTLAQLDVRPGEAIFVDDKALNIEAARRIGMYAVLFKGTLQAIDEIQRILMGEASSTTLPYNDVQNR